MVDFSFNLPELAKIKISDGNNPLKGGTNIADEMMKLTLGLSGDENMKNGNVDGFSRGGQGEVAKAKEEKENSETKQGDAKVKTEEMTEAFKEKALESAIAEQNLEEAENNRNQIQKINKAQIPSVSRLNPGSISGRFNGSKGSNFSDKAVNDASKVSGLKKQLGNKVSEKVKSVLDTSENGEKAANIDAVNSQTEAVNKGNENVKLNQDVAEGKEKIATDNVEKTKQTETKGVEQTKKTEAEKEIQYQNKVEEAEAKCVQLAETKIQKAQAQITAATAKKTAFQTMLAAANAGIAAATAQIATGEGMIKAGEAMLSNPFTAAAGHALIASGTTVKTAGEALKKTSEANKKTAENGIQQSEREIQTAQNEKAEAQREKTEHTQKQNEAREKKHISEQDKKAAETKIKECDTEIKRLNDEIKTIEEKNKEEIAEIKKNTEEIKKLTKHANDCVKQANEYVNRAKQVLKMAQSAGNNSRQQAYSQQCANTLKMNTNAFNGGLLNSIQKGYNPALAGATGNINLFDPGKQAQDQKAANDKKAGDKFREITDEANKKPEASESVNNGSGTGMENVINEHGSGKPSSGVSSSDKESAAAFGNIAAGAGNKTVTPQNSQSDVQAATKFEEVFSTKSEPSNTGVSSTDTQEAANAFKTLTEEQSIQPDKSVDKTETDIKQEDNKETDKKIDDKTEDKENTAIKDEDKNLNSDVANLNAFLKNPNANFGKNPLQKSENQSLNADNVKGGKNNNSVNGVTVSQQTIGEQKLLAKLENSGLHVDGDIKKAASSLNILTVSEQNDMVKDLSDEEKNLLKKAGFKQRKSINFNG